MNINELLDIELILEEANAVGLRNEVSELAKELLEVGLPHIQAYQLAFNELVKLNEI